MVSIPYRDDKNYNIYEFWSSMSLRYMYFLSYSKILSFFFTNMKLLCCVCSSSFVIYIASHHVPIQNFQALFFRMIFIIASFTTFCILFQSAISFLIFSNVYEFVILFLIFTIVWFLKSMPIAILYASFFLIFTFAFFRSVASFSICKMIDWSRIIVFTAFRYAFLFQSLIGTIKTFRNAIHYSFCSKISIPYRDDKNRFKIFFYLFIA